MRSYTVSDAVSASLPFFDSTAPFFPGLLTASFCLGGSNQFFETIQAGVEFFDILFRWDIILMDEKFDHGIKCDCFMFSSYH